MSHLAARTATDVVRRVCTVHTNFSSWTQMASSSSFVTPAPRPRATRFPPSQKHMSYISDSDDDVVPGRVSFGPTRPRTPPPSVSDATQKVLDSWADEDTDSTASVVAATPPPRKKTKIVDLTGDVKDATKPYGEDDKKGQSKYWVGTLNGTAQQVNDGIMAIRFNMGMRLAGDDKTITYFASCTETGDEEKRLHAHMFVAFTKNQRWSALDKMPDLKRWWFVPMGKFSTPRKAVDYFKYMTGKPDSLINPTFQEIGDFPEPAAARAAGRKKGGAETSAKWDASRAFAMDASKDLLDLPDSQHLIIHLGGLREIRRMSLQKTVPKIINGPLMNLWIHGATGTGKSTLARKWAQRLCDKHGWRQYIKDTQSKWWGDYQNEQVVIMDDMGHQGPTPCQMKQWGDRHPVQVESKGSQMTIRPMVIIVTSNYRIAQIYPNKEEDTQPLQRRFIECEVVKGKLCAYDAGDKILIRSIVEEGFLP